MRERRSATAAMSSEAPAPSPHGNGCRCSSSAACWESTVSTSTAARAGCCSRSVPLRWNACSLRKWSMSPFRTPSGDSSWIHEPGGFLALLQRPDLDTRGRAVFELGIAFRDLDGILQVLGADVVIANLDFMARVQRRDVPVGAGL